MQPDEDRRRKAHQGIARARLLLKRDLGWLPGFPRVEVDSAIDNVSDNHAPPSLLPFTSSPRGRVDRGQGTTESANRLSWWSLLTGAQSATVVTLDREQLRRMEMTLTKLRRRFPRALPKLVEDVDDWLGRMDVLLAVLKRAVHQQLSPDVSTWFAEGALSRRWGDRILEMWHRHASLRPFLDAVFFLEMTGLSRPSMEAFDWIETHAPALGALSGLAHSHGGDRMLEIQLFFYLLRSHMHPDLLAVLLSWLADETVWRCPRTDLGQYIAQLSAELQKAARFDPFQIPDRPPQKHLGDICVRFLTELLLLKPKARWVVSELLGLLIPLDSRARLHAICTQIDIDETRMARLLRRLDNRVARLHRRKEDVEELKALENVAVDDQSQQYVAHLDHAFTTAPKLARDVELLSSWSRFLSRVPAGLGSLRLELFAGWEHARKRCGEVAQPARNLQFILNRLEPVVGRYGVPEALRSHWEIYGHPLSWRTEEFVRDFLYGSPNRETMERTVQLMAKVVCERRVSLNRDLFCSLVEFTKGTPDLDLAAHAVAELASQEGNYYTSDETSAAFSIATDGATAARILRILKQNSDLCQTVVLLGRELRDHRLRRIVQTAILTKNRRLLFRLAASTRLVTACELEPPELPEFADSIDWVERYPLPLRETLGQLNRIVADAPHVARALLSKDFPDEERLRREIAALRERIAKMDDVPSRRHMEARLANLEQRRSISETVSARRLNNLVQRVAERVDHEVVAAYLRACHLRAAQRLRVDYGTVELTEEMFRAPFDQLLSGILQLKVGMRKLGMRLLLHRFQEGAGDFADEPKNVAFRQQLEAKGVSLEPWLSDSFELVAKIHDGEPYRVSFTRDVVDYLMMGLHFDTCLSPGSENFFSTIANAVDINKQVVYGKTFSGRVIGRCLFTLTDQGSILTYHRYAHDPANAFDAAVEQFADQLAQAMNTRRASSGKVPILVARDWYDDGAVGREEVLDLQSEDGAVRTLLRTAEPDRLLDDLRRVVGTDDDLRSVLGPLLYVEELRCRPGIVAPFVDAYAFDTSVAFKERYRLAILARGAGLTESAQAIVSSLRPNTLPARLEREHCAGCCAFHGIGSCEEVFGVLIDASPTLALRAIRATRSSTCSRDMDEVDPDRRQVLARVHQLLGRDHLAAQLAAPIERSS